MAPSRRSLSVSTISGAGVATGLALLALTGASAVPAATPAALSLAPRNGRAVRLRAPHARSITATPGWASTNWSGYAVTTTSKFTTVTGAWAVPSVAPTSGATYSAAWVGIDGFANSSLIQTGTEQDYYNGAAHYAVWWTTSAQGFAEQPINDLAVHAFGANEIEIEAQLLATSVDGEELDRLTAQLAAEPFISQAFWSPSTTE